MASKIWDKLGICASGLCLLHCISTPIILALFPALRSFFVEEEIVHIIFAFIVLLPVMIAVFPQCAKHGHYDILLRATMGLILVISGIFTHEFNEILSVVLSILGSILLINAHLKNMRVRHGKCSSSH